ncbi:hypothetical protein EDD27_5288 [Nonomuraea polychroma]|uniref:Uncharacterized protein n=1 Tax=Nonomuraea polychroma TaxID=46176 RepID=A0A438MAA4_9ACTN|nr:hypothetical protein [Nonomuraea polychroma]RVX42651.1 hypothetical protein EDD27_5288 [Nonomuraea polychroma]
MRVQQRVDRSVGAADLLREEIAAWLADRSADRALGRFAHHFGVLDQVLNGMLRRVRDSLLAAAQLPSSQEVYARCAALDRSLVTVKRLFEWYAPKYDQRADPVRGPALAAADEVVRSCWWQPFEALGRRPPAGPLPYLDPLFDASATPRRSVPEDLRAPVDSVVAELITELPIPVISLPAWAVREAWWLVVAAHETGHLVMRDLTPSLARQVKIAVGEWSDWADEIFADVYSALMVGPAAAWMVEELQHGVIFSSPYYPPLATRLALIAGRAPGETGESGVSKVVSSILSLDVDGHPLAELCRGLDERLAAVWASSLATHKPTITKVGSRAAARTMIAAGVAGHAADPRRTHENLIAHLPRCGPPGTMGSAPAAPEIAALADRLAARVVPP